MPATRPREDLELSLELAEKFKADDEAFMERFNRVEACRMMLRCALTESAAAEGGRLQLSEMGALQQLERILELGVDELEPSRALDLAHIAILIERRDLGLVLLSRRSLLAKGLWRTYGELFWALIARKEIQVQLPKVSGGQKRVYAPYLNLMVALRAGAAVDSAVAAVQESFSWRHSDKRWSDEGLLDGDREEPVRWDFRCAAILAAAEMRPDESGTCAS